MVLVFSLIAVFTLTGCDQIFRQILPVPPRPANTVQPPSITDLFASAITNNSAQIVWRTVKPAASRVNYGLTAALGTEIAALDATVAHAVDLTNLVSGTKYYFVATSYDTLGNSVTSALLNFTTENVGSDTTGPLTSSLSATPNPTAGSTAVLVTALVSDASTGGSNVTAAECFIDAQGANGAGIVLNAQDGVYNSVTESVSGLVTMTGLSAGAHTLYVNGRDASNNWGASQTFALTVSAGGGSDTTGPQVTVGPALTPNPTAGVTTITITATISDAAVGNANISAAEYFVDTVGANGAGVAMTAVDGAFNSPTEAVTKTAVNIAALITGDHTVYVHGKDALNNWGTTQPIVLHITTAGVKPDAASTAVVSYTQNTKPEVAVWIEDNNGVFVRTLFVTTHAAGSSTYLPTWWNASTHQTNGTTGASKSAGSYTASWNPPNNTAGTVVSAGNYRYRIVARTQNSVEMPFSGTISIGATATSSTGNNGTYITSLSANYTP